MLNETSIKILEIVKINNDFEEIINQFSSYYDIEKQKAESDLKLFIKKAEDLQILEVEYDS